MTDKSVMTCLKVGLLPGSCTQQFFISSLYWGIMSAEGGVSGRPPFFSISCTCPHTMTSNTHTSSLLFPSLAFSERNMTNTHTSLLHFFPFFSISEPLHTRWRTTLAHLFFIYLWGGGGCRIKVFWKFLYQMFFISLSLSLSLSIHALRAMWQSTV